VYAYVVGAAAVKADGTYNDPQRLRPPLSRSLRPSRR